MKYIVYKQRKLKYLINVHYVYYYVIEESTKVIRV